MHEVKKHFQFAFSTLFATENTTKNKVYTRLENPSILGVRF